MRILDDTIYEVTYMIVRFYQDEDKPREVRDDTKGDGWFDGYTKEVE